MHPPAAGDDEHFLRAALALAAEAARRGEIPIGAVVVYNGRIIGRGANAREQRADPAAHAEVLALREAGAWIGNWRLTGCTLYATIEPCVMCAGAALFARVERVVYGAPDPKFGGLGSIVNVAEQRFNHRFAVTGGVLADECAHLMREFFQARRRSAAVSRAIDSPLDPEG